jgi:phosphatidylglycerol:prolipoprotein diacylglycerol transferase
MVALGFLVTGFLLKKELKRTGIPSHLGDSIVIGAMLGGIAGAKLYSAIEGLNDLGMDSLSLSTFFSGSGLVWYGGLAGGVIVVLIIIRRSHNPMMKVIDLIAPLLILGYAFGRMGCFLSGDGDYGPPTDLPWGMAFPKGMIPTWKRVHPTPLYEIALSLMIFVFLWRMRKRNWPTGWMFGMYLVLAGVERFVTEFWRLTPVVAFGMTMAQLISIALVIAGVSLILRSRKVQAMTPRTS